MPVAAISRMKIENNASSRFAFFALLTVVAVFHFVTMPNAFYPGDNMAIKAEASQLVNTGRAGFDVSEKDALGDLVTQEGQYFFVNEARQRLFSKYGLFYTLSYVPPIWLKKQITGSLEVVDVSASMTFAFNCYNILWSLLYVAYLYRVYRYCALGPWQAAGLVVLSVYPSYVWYYLRSPEKEVLQMAAFAGAVYHMLRYLGSSREGRPANGQLMAAFGWGGYTYLLKPLYALLLLAMAGSAFYDALCRWRQAQGRHAQFAPWLRSLLSMGGMLLLIGVISLVHNYLRSGAIFDAGYRQDTTVPIEFVFTPNHFFQGLATYFLQPGNGNWFLHHPLLLVALFGYPAFFRAYRMEALFLLAALVMLLVALCFHVEWVGEWCYGPRFCLHLIMMAGIPAGQSMAWLLAPSQGGMVRKAARTAALAGVVMVSLLSLRAQLYINSWHYFTYYYYFVPFDSLKIEAADQYFSAMPHRALLNRDLTLYRREGRKFALLDSIDQAQLPAGTVAAIYGLTEEVIEHYRWNFLLLPRPGS